ncbi:MAG: zinc ribbon domain-containing protein [Oscillospiraceae bacterium]|nr:zinc ribbon domain-containing protein [Oscillospiraceae bacterium]
MFCSKCGKTIDDNATFCGFCGAPTNNATNAVMNGAPQQNAPQSDIPQPTNPTQQAAPQYGAPQYNAQPVSTGFKLNLDPKMVDIINKALRGLLALLGLLTLIGAIGSWASIGAMLGHASKYHYGSTFNAAYALYNFSNLARIPAILAFVFSGLGVAFTILTKQKSLFSYIAAGSGILMFIFNFVMLGSFYSLAVGGIIVSSIFLIISALAMIASSVIIIMKKEDIIPFKPKF